MAFCALAIQLGVCFSASACNRSLNALVLEIACKLHNAYDRKMLTVVEA